MESKEQELASALDNHPKVIQKKKLLAEQEALKLRIEDLEDELDERKIELEDVEDQLER